MNAPEQKEIVDEFVKESEAVRLMKLKEAVYHPEPFWRLNSGTIAILLLVMGCVLPYFRPVLELRQFGGVLILMIALFVVHEIRIRGIHDRIDKLLELEFEKPDKQSPI